MLCGTLLYIRPRRFVPCALGEGENTTLSSLYAVNGRGLVQRCFVAHSNDAL